MIEGPLAKGRWKRSVEEGLLEQVCQRRSAREGPSEKRDVDGSGPIGKRVVAGKVVGNHVKRKNNSKRNITL